MNKVALVGLAIIAAGCGSPEPLFESARQPIITGAVNTGDPAIMELYSSRGQLGARCTATLITPRLLIAAAHCLTETPGFQRHVFPGNDDRMATEKDMLPVKAVVANPAYRGAPRMGNDFSIIVLQTPLPIRPIPLNRAAVESAQGKMVRYVGYGLVQVGNPQSGGVKRHNTAPLAQVSRLLLSIGANAHPACEGDSGGPLLFDDGQGEKIIGISSFVTNPACQRDSFYQRVDTQLAWIDEQIQLHDPGGLAPAADGGAIDGGSPISADASVPDAAPTPPSGSPPDARSPEPDLAPSPALPSPDAGPADVARPPQSAPPPMTTSGSTGGCSYASQGAPRSRGADAGALAIALFALAWATRRRSSRRRWA